MRAPSPELRAKPPRCHPVHNPLPVPARVRRAVWAIGGRGGRTAGQGPLTGCCYGRAVVEGELYWMCAVRFPRWSPELPELLAAAEIDVFRPPASYRNEPVWVTLELYAADREDARMRIRAALAPTGVSLAPQDFGVCGMRAEAPPDRFQPRPPLQD